MTTMTIHPDEVVMEALRARANELGKSINQTVMLLLAPALGLVKAVKPKKNVFADVCGMMSEAEAAEFGRALEAQRKIEPEMWQ